MSAHLSHTIPMPLGFQTQPTPHWLHLLASWTPTTVSVRWIETSPSTHLKKRTDPNLHSYPHPKLLHKEFWKDTYQSECRLIIQSDDPFTILSKFKSVNSMTFVDASSSANGIVLNSIDVCPETKQPPQRNNSSIAACIIHIFILNIILGQCTRVQSNRQSGSHG